MIFPVCDPDEMSLWSLTLIPSLARDQGGGQWMLCQRWDYPGLSILMSLTERITSEYSGRGWCWARPSGSGDTGEVVCKCDHWLSHHQTSRCPWCGEWCPHVPSFSPVSAAIPGCHLYLSPAFLSHWHNVGVIPAIRRQGSQLIIDRFQSWLTSLAPGPVSREWVGVIQRLCQSSGCQLKLLFLSKELKMLLVLLTVAYQSQASWGSRSMHHSHTFTCSG